MLSRSYTKVVDIKAKPHFPVILTGDSNFQETISYAFTEDALYYQLVYVEGETLDSKCKRLVTDRAQLINLINSYIDWYQKYCIYRFEENYLMLNSDSNAANIIVTASDQFVHIDNLSDFLRVTQDPCRPFLPLMRLLLDLGLSSNDFVRQLNLPEGYEAYLEEAADIPDNISRLNDLLVSSDRDTLYQSVLLGKGGQEGLLRDLLIDATESYRSYFAPTIFGILERDFANARCFVDSYLPKLT